MAASGEAAVLGEGVERAWVSVLEPVLGCQMAGLEVALW
jgi:hypothetical protein